MVDLDLRYPVLGMVEYVSRVVHRRHVPFGWMLRNPVVLDVHRQDQLMVQTIVDLV